MATERELAKRVKERFGVGVPRWRNGARAYSRQEKAEQRALVEWLCNDDDYLRLFGTYFGYCDILYSRGFYGPKDLVAKIPVDDWHEKVRKNFAKCTVGYIYHDMCCDPETILGSGSADGYWIYLDRPWLDITHMKVGPALLNLDEVWAVASHTLEEWDGKCHSREVRFHDKGGYYCDRCGQEIHRFERAGCRFDVYENLLHCRKCAETCSYWANIDGKAGRRG